MYDRDRRRGGGGYTLRAEERWMRRRDLGLSGTAAMELVAMALEGECGEMKMKPCLFGF